MPEETAIEWFLNSIPQRFRNMLINECFDEIQQAKQMEHKHIEKEKQKQLLIEIMEADEKDGLYKTNNMKLYTEEQVREAMQKSRYAFSTDKSYDEILKSLTPIELPSDKEMDRFLLDNSYEYGYGYRDAIDWIKKQILNQSK